MGRPAYEPKTGRSKFTEERRNKLLEAFALGGSPQTACALARISTETLYRWLKKGEAADEESQWNKFYLDIMEARALPRERALRIVHESMRDYPMLAFKYLERQEDGYAPPTVAQAPVSNGPQVIQLNFSDGNPIDNRNVIDGTIVEGEVIDGPTSGTAALPAP